MTILKTSIQRMRPYFNWKMVLLVLATVLAVGVIGAYVFPSQKPLQFIATPAAYGDIEQVVLAEGTLQPIQQVDVGAQASGQIISLKVSLGDSIRKGQLIAIIDPSTQQNALFSAEATLAQYRASRRVQQIQLDQYKKVLDRRTVTYAGSASSLEDYEAATANLEQAKATLAAADALIKQQELTVATARVNVGYTQIVAPMDGVVIAIVTKQGQTVIASQQPPTIVKLANLQTMTVKAQISETDILKVYPGQPVYFSVAGDTGRRFYATLRALAPAPDSTATEASTANTGRAAAVYYSALFDVPNDDGRLRPGMTAEVSIVLKSAKHVLLVPSSALGSVNDDRSTVTVLDPSTGRPTERAVTVGINNNISAQILNGLEAGESVVINGGQAMLPSLTETQK